MKWVIRYAIPATMLAALAFFSYLMVRITLPYTSFRSDVQFLKAKAWISYMVTWRVSFYIHVLTGVLVLIAGFTQFSRYLLRHYPRVHRVMGLTYVITVVFVTGPAALFLAWYANGGLPGRVSFVLLATLWITFTALSWYFAVRRKFAQHAAFLYRSYALTLSAITLRLYTFFLESLHPAVSHRDIYIVTAWLAWVPNLLVAEWIIQYQGRRLGKLT